MSDNESDRGAVFEASGMMTSLTVRDLAASKRWYVDVMGFTVEEEHEHEGKVVAIALRAGTVSLMINQDNGAKGWERVKGEGISLMLSTTQNIDAVAARIKAAGGTLATEPADMPWGARVFRVQDPDGFKIAISS